MKDDFDKDIDLHKSEWKRAGKREPVLGPGFIPFISYAIGGLIMLPIAKLITYFVLGQ